MPNKNSHKHIRDIGRSSNKKKQEESKRPYTLKTILQDIKRGISWPYFITILTPLLGYFLYTFNPAAIAVVAFYTTFVLTAAVLKQRGIVLFPDYGKRN